MSTSSNSRPLSGRTALVTGGTRGIGAAIGSGGAGRIAFTGSAEYAGSNTVRAAVEMLKGLPALRRHGTAEEVAAVGAFLVSLAASCPCRIPGGRS